MICTTKNHALIHCLISFCLFLGICSPLTAQTEDEFQPVLVASISSVDELMSDLDALASMVGMEGVDWAALTQNEATFEAIDKTRPIGAIVRTNGTEFETLAFIPVKDFQALLAALQPYIGEASDNGDGIYEIEQPLSLYVKHENGWAFISQDMDRFMDLPADPASLLGQLHKEYDVGVRAHIHNVPEIYRQMTLGWIQFSVQEELSQLDGLEDSQSEMRRQWMNNSLQQMNALINETDTISVGWTVDQDQRQIEMDLTMTAVEGTGSAERMKKIKLVTSQHAGFLLDDAAFKMHFHTEMADDDIQNTIQMLNGVKVGALGFLEQDDEFSNEESREQAQQVLGGLFDIIVSTVESGVLEGGVAVIANQSELTVVAGGRLQDGDVFKNSLKKLADLVEREDGAPKVQWAAGRIGSVELHELYLPIEDENVAKLLGDQLHLVMGTGARQGYLALGNGADKLLQRVIEESAKRTEEMLPPSQVTIAMSPVVEYLASLEDSFSMSEGLADVALGENGRDRVIVETLPIEGGALSRIVVEEDALRVIAEIAQMVYAQIQAAAIGQFQQEFDPEF